MNTEHLFDAEELAWVREMRAPGGDEQLVSVAARAAWTSLSEPGDAVANELVRQLGPARALASVIERRPAEDICNEFAQVDPAERAGTMDALAGGLARWTPRADRALLRRRLEIGSLLGAVVSVPTDVHWPDGVEDLGPHAPLALWVRGDVGALAPSRSIALVGARASTGYGEHVAAELSAGLVNRGVRVLSGAAFGIDGVAHRAALAARGSTVAFLAGGPDRLYPSGHTVLLEGLIGAPGCAVVSELPPGSSPTRWRFLQRNRLIASASCATVVVEAGARSGSLNTAGHAAAIGRPLGAVPGPVTSASSAGCHRLMREFTAVCVTGVDDALELLGEPASALLPTEAGDPCGTRVEDALSVRTPRESMEVARASGLAINEVLGVLGTLLADGKVERTEDGRWRARRRSR